MSFGPSFNTQNKVTVPVFKELIRLTMGSQIIIIGILLPTTVGGIKKKHKVFHIFQHSDTKKLKALLFSRHTF